MKPNDIFELKIISRILGLIHLLHNLVNFITHRQNFILVVHELLLADELCHHVVLNSRNRYLLSVVVQVVQILPHFVFSQFPFYYAFIVYPSCK